MSEVLEDPWDNCSWWRKDLTFADDIDGLAGNKREHRDLIESLNQTSSKFGVETSAQKPRFITNNAEGIQDKRRLQARSTVSNCTNNICFYVDEADMEWHENHNPLQDETSVLPSHFNVPVCLGSIVHDCLAREKNFSLGDEMLSWNSSLTGITFQKRRLKPKFI